jgi:pilus assembly protein Flp/PilA
MHGRPEFNGSSTTQAQTPSWPTPDAGLHGRGSVIPLKPRGRPEMVKFLILLKNEDGATAIEYGLIAALIAVAAIGAMQGIGNKLNVTFNNVSNNLPSS